MTIKVSNDEGNTWPAKWHTLVDERSTAYSCMTPVGKDKIGLVYEAPGELYFAMAKPGSTENWLLNPSSRVTIKKNCNP